MAKSMKQEEYTQEIRGVLSLKQVKEIDPDLKIKIAVARHCWILYSQVFQVDPKRLELKYSIVFKTDQQKPMGVNLVVGPGDAPDEKLRSLDVHEQWVPAKEFREGAATVNVAISPRLYGRWRIVCVKHTIRGRVVCRRIVWDWREHRFVICDSPVRGARVTAYDVDRFWWWCRRDQVGSDFTDIHGNFEITYNWCCWKWRPWFLSDWKIEPELVKPITELLRKVPLKGPIPTPDPEPDFRIFEQLAESAAIAGGGGTRSLQMASAPGSSADFNQLGKQLVRILPESPRLEAMHIWPWWPFFDCKPDIVFRVTQDCGRGEQVIYSESCAKTRWDTGYAVTGVTLVANSNACCAPVCCHDHPDDDCLVIQGVGCGGYPITSIEQDPTNPLVGFAEPGTNDRPFGDGIRLLGVFGDGSDVDFYKVQSRRISPAPTAWADLPDDQVGTFYRGHWLGVFPWIQWEAVKLDDASPVDSRKVLKTKKRYREEHPEVDATVDPNNDDWLTIWETSTTSSPVPGTVDETPKISDGVYQVPAGGVPLQRSDTDALR